MIKSTENFIMISFIAMFISVLILSCAIILRQWLKDKKSPLIVTYASVADKRTQKHCRRTKNSSGSGTVTHSFSLYYITFQLEGGDCIELLTNSKTYNKLKTGQHGKLTFKGSKYLGFEKSK